VLGLHITGRTIGLEVFQRVEHLHRARHHGVVLHALVVVVHLLEHAVDLQAQRAGAPAVARRRCSGGDRGPGGCAKFQTRRRKRYEPSTAASFHSSVASGGAVNMVYRRAVSAPYFSIRSCGSTPLRSLLPILPMPP
jgi:hypothetical protein